MCIANNLSDRTRISFDDLVKDYSERIKFDSSLVTAFAQNAIDMRLERKVCSYADNSICRDGCWIKNRLRKEIKSLEIWILQFVTVLVGLQIRSYSCVSFVVQLYKIASACNQFSWLEFLILYSSFSIISVILNKTTRALIWEVVSKIAKQNTCDTLQLDTKRLKRLQELSFESGPPSSSNSQQSRSNNHWLDSSLQDTSAGSYSKK